MIEELRQGFFGLALFLGQWLSPGGGHVQLSVNDIQLIKSHIKIICNLEIPWNHDLERIIDSGIPLRFKYQVITNQNDSITGERLLQCDIVNLTYSFTDSLHTIPTIKKSKNYPQILLALQDFCKWGVKLNNQVTSCKIIVEIVPVYVDRLNRTIDLSSLIGSRRCEMNLIIPNKNSLNLRK